MNKNATVWIMVLIAAVGIIVLITAINVFQHSAPELRRYTNSVDELKKEIQAPPPPADTSQE